MGLAGLVRAMALFGRIDAVHADAALPVAGAQRDGVAVGHVDDRAGQRVAARRNAACQRRAGPRRRRGRLRGCALGLGLARGRGGITAPRGLKPIDDGARRRKDQGDDQGGQLAAAAKWGFATHRLGSR
ncbi:hypothetical protein D3C87_1538840 [compost metagenome]